MATAKITKQVVDNVVAGEKDKLIWDAKLPGFGLKVTPRGGKVFIFQYRLGGRGAKVRRYTIGKYGALTPDNARREAERLAMRVAQGADPQREKVDSRRQAIALAFDSYLERFDRDCLHLTWPSSRAEVRRMLDRYALPVLADMPLTAIARADIRDVLAPVRSLPATSARLFATLRRLFTWAISEGDIAMSPMAGMEAPTPPSSRDRVLEDDEISLVWHAAGNLGHPFGPFVRLLILTGARREEVAGLRWSELRQNAAMWSIPAERANNGNAVQIPLSSLAVAEISSVARRGKKRDDWPRKGLLFFTTGTTPISGYSKAKKRLDNEVAELTVEKTPLGSWRLHDLRRTFATGMQRLGVRSKSRRRY